jgi:simple sugar transport system permease protein
VRLPRLKLEKVLVVTGRDAVKISVISIIIAFTLFSIFLFIEGANPIDAYKNIFSYAFDPSTGLPTTIHRSMLLLFATLAFILPLKAGLWNVGMEGQLYLGTVGAFAIAYAWGGLPSGILIPFMLTAAALFGAIYGAFAGFLRGKLGVNEIVITLMLNNIAYWLLQALTVWGPWRGIAESQSRPLPTSAWAPEIWKVPFTVILAPVISVILYFLFKRSTIGFQIRTFGSSQPAAEHAGMNPFKISLFVMAVGGAIAGLSAYHMWAGDPSYRLIPRPEAYKGIGDFTYWGILVGLICILNPIASIPAAIFVGSLREGGTVLVRRLGLTYGLDFVFMGILFLAFIALQFFYRYRIVRAKKRG